MASKNSVYARTQTELAKALGRSLASIAVYKAEGAPVRKSKRGYRIDPVRKWIKENRKQNPGRRASKGNKSKEVLTDYAELYEKERALKTKAERERAELRQKIEAGEYIPLSEVKERDRARIAAVTSGLKTLPRRIAQECEGLTANQIEIKLREHFRDLRRKFAGF